jgi:hypothetical protein
MNKRTDEKRTGQKSEYIFRKELVLFEKNQFFSEKELGFALGLTHPIASV